MVHFCPLLVVGVGESGREDLLGGHQEQVAEDQTVGGHHQEQGVGGPVDHEAGQVHVLVFLFPL